MTDAYFLLGSAPESSPSPSMFNSAFASSHLDAAYSSLTVPASLLGQAVSKLRADRVSGFNVTIPHKEAISHLLDSLDPVSRSAGAVNTVARVGDDLRGFNTDVDGILRPLAQKGLRPVSALVLGTGGAARAFCAAMEKVGCKELAPISRERSRARAFSAAMSKAFESIAFTPLVLGNPAPFEADLLFNASPLGSPGFPAEEDVFHYIHPRQTVFDAVYSPVETELLSRAKRAGCLTIPGHEMLLHQAARAFTIWTGLAPPTETMREALIKRLEARAA